MKLLIYSFYYSFCLITVILFARWFLTRKDSKISKSIGAVLSKTFNQRSMDVFTTDSRLYEHTEESLIYGLSLNLVFVIKDVQFSCAFSHFQSDVLDSSSTISATINR